MIPTTDNRVCRECRYHFVKEIEKTTGIILKKTETEKRDYCNVMIDEVTGESCPQSCHFMRRGRSFHGARISAPCHNGSLFESKK